MSHIMTFEAKKTCEEDCFTKHTKITAYLTSSRWCKNCTIRTLSNVCSDNQGSPSQRQQEAEVARIAWEAESGDLMQSATTTSQPQARNSPQVSINTHYIRKALFSLLKWPYSVCKSLSVAFWLYPTVLVLCKYQNFQSRKDNRN